MSNSVVPTGYGSTYLNNTNLQSYGDLVYHLKSMMGYPAADIELTDSQWAQIIDYTINTWTQFEGGRKEEYLVFCSNLYHQSCGVKLDELVQVGCNKQECLMDIQTYTVTSTDVLCETIETRTAYLSVSPWVYPTPFDRNDPNSVAFTGTSAQFITIYFDPKNPWKAETVCSADCITINPVSSQWFQLSANSSLSATVFDFINDTTISSLTSAISSQILDGYALSAVPLTAMGRALTAIPISYYDLAAFYPENFNVGPPVSACLNIGHGRGFLYPNCDASKMNACSALTAQFGISPTWNYVLTSIPITSVNIATSATNFSTISAYFTLFCNDCNCNCAFLSSYSESLSSYSFSLSRPVVSGTDGIFDLSARNVANATHVKIYNIPTCTDDGSIPLVTNDGIIASFVLCNSAFSTSGPMYVENVQFMKDYKPPAEILYDQTCNWNNNGFTMSYYNSQYPECSRYTPEKVKVDVSFCKKNIVTSIGTVSSVLSGNYDYGIERRRKVLGVFEVFAGSEAGYGGYGGDLLFNFDYALMASTFGFDLQGQRTANYSKGYDLLTYHLAKSFVEQSRKMLRYTSYQFDPKTQYLKLTPSPYSNNYNSTVSNDTAGCCNTKANNMCYIAGLYLEPTIEECLNEYWVKEYALAKAVQTLGFIRGKFANVVLFGGMQLQGSELSTWASTRLEALMKELRDENRYVAPPVHFLG